jgi:hypothetical protein
MNDVTIQSNKYKVRMWTDFKRLRIRYSAEKFGAQKQFCVLHKSVEFLDQTEDSSLLSKCFTESDGSRYFLCGTLNLLLLISLHRLSAAYEFYTNRSLSW